jgi:GNAT superfamily N-acetyltransferase
MAPFAAEMRTRIDCIEPRIIHEVRISHPYGFQTGYLFDSRLCGLFDAADGTDGDAGIVAYVLTQRWGGIRRLGFARQLSVEPHFCRKGLGRALLTAFEELCIKKKCDVLGLIARPPWRLGLRPPRAPWLKPFYESMGYEVVCRRRSVMAKAL